VLADMYARLREQANKALVGQDAPFELLLVGLLVGGNVLLEGVPGTGKTLMAKLLAHLVGGQYQRVQFTPDLMPSDIVGTNVYDLASGQFHVRRGPVFCNVLLADEINRAPAKTQSALLEAMEERQVTIEGQRFDLPEVFMVIATQNPVEYEGTYPLPEAQLDRFLFKIILEHAPAEVEREVIRRYHHGFDPHHLEQAGILPVLQPADVLEARQQVQTVTVDDGVLDYLTNLGRATRADPDLLLGASVRGPVALLQGAKALAALRGRSFVVPDDVKALLGPALRHRVILRPEAEIEGLTVDEVLSRVASRVEVPR
jgi:MoxR-like ATPase